MAIFRTLCSHAGTQLCGLTALRLLTNKHPVQKEVFQKLSGSDGEEILCALPPDWWHFPHVYFESYLSSQNPPCWLLGGGRPSILLYDLTENHKQISTFPCHSVPFHALAVGRLILHSMDSPIITEHTSMNNCSLPAASVCNGWFRSSSWSTRHCNLEGRWPQRDVILSVRQPSSVVKQNQTMLFNFTCKSPLHHDMLLPLHPGQ